MRPYVAPDRAWPAINKRQFHRDIMLSSWAGAEGLWSKDRLNAVRFIDFRFSKGSSPYNDRDQLSP